MPKPAAMPYATHKRLAVAAAVVLPQIPAGAERDELLAALQGWLDDHNTPPFTLAREMRPAADPLDAPARAAVVKATCRLGGVAYVRWTEHRGWACTLANGTPAAMSYAGFDSDDDTAARIALDRAKTVREVLAICRARSSAAIELA